MQKSFERFVPYSAEQMLALVADVESYPQFVPHCRDMSVVRDSINPKTRYAAKMHIQFGPIAQAYTSRIEVDSSAMTLKASSVDGPFSHLNSIWRFDQTEQGTRVAFDIDFRIANPLIRAVAEPAFAAKQEEIIDAFMAEARRRYA